MLSWTLVQTRFSLIIAARLCGLTVSVLKRWLVNIFVERLWRSVKYEKTYLEDYEAAYELRNCWPRTSILQSGAAAPALVEPLQWKSIGRDWNNTRQRADGLCKKSKPNWLYLIFRRYCID